MKSEKSNNFNSHRYNRRFSETYRRVKIELQILNKLSS